MNNKFVASIAAIPFAVAGVFAGAGAANAVALSGDITINGNLTRTTSGGVTTLDFTDIDDIEASGDFSNFTFDFTTTGPNAILPVAAPNFIDIKTLKLTPTGFSPSVDPLVSFLDFGQRKLMPGGEVGFLTFDLNEPSSVFISPNTVAFDASGVWQFNGQTIGKGGVTMSQAGGSRSYTISLETVESVPEPTTLFGLGVVTAGLVASRRKKSS